MRVITGTAKSIPLISKDPRTVPLSDRAKSALFAIIDPVIPHAYVLDLYAGSGALGIEALSRGAEHAAFVDISNKSIESIHENLAKTNLADKADVLKMDVEHFLDEFIDQYDLIFVCPPYPHVKYHVVKMAASILAQNGILIFEHHKKDRFKPVPDLQLVDEREYGIVKFEIYQKV